jgi:hypothetical protein
MMLTRVALLVGELQLSTHELIISAIALSLRGASIIFQKVSMVAGYLEGFCLHLSSTLESCVSRGSGLNSFAP